MRRIVGDFELNFDVAMLDEVWEVCQSSAKERASDVARAMLCSSLRQRIWCSPQCVVFYVKEVQPSPNNIMRGRKLRFVHALVLKYKKMEMCVCMQCSSVIAELGAHCH